MKIVIPHFRSGWQFSTPDSHKKREGAFAGTLSGINAYVVCFDYCVVTSGWVSRFVPVFKLIIISAWQRSSNAFGLNTSGFSVGLFLPGSSVNCLATDYWLPFSGRLQTVIQAVSPYSLQINLKTVACWLLAYFLIRLVEDCQSSDFSLHFAA